MCLTLFSDQYCNVARTSREGIQTPLTSPMKFPYLMRYSSTTMSPPTKICISKNTCQPANTNELTVVHNKSLRMRMGHPKKFLWNRVKEQDTMHPLHQSPPLCPTHLERNECSPFLILSHVTAWLFYKYIFQILKRVSNYTCHQSFQDIFPSGI